MSEAESPSGTFFRESSRETRGTRVEKHYNEKLSSSPFLSLSFFFRRLIKVAPSTAAINLTLALRYINKTERLTLSGIAHFRYRVRQI